VQFSSKKKTLGFNSILLFGMAATLLSSAAVSIMPVSAQILASSLITYTGYKVAF